MSKSFDLSAIFKVVDRASLPIKSIGRSIAKLSEPIAKVSKKLSAMGKKMREVGKGMTMKLTAPIAAFGALAIRSATNFQDAMNKVGAITRASAEDMEKLKVAARDAGKTTQFSATQSADAMSFLAMAGLDVNQTIEALPGTLQLAAAGGMDLATAADIATNVMTSMGLKVKDLTHVNDVLAVAQSRANTNITELAEAMKPIAGTASTLGMSLEETTATLAKMADVGNKGGIAGTLLRNALMALALPTEKTKRVFSELNMNLEDFTTKDGKVKDFSLMVDQLSESGATAGQIMEAFGKRGGRAILDLQKSGGANLRKLTAELKASDGAAKEMAETMMKGLPGAFKRLGSVWEAVQLSIMDSGVGDFIEKVINKLITFLEEVAESSPNLLLIISIIAGIVAALGPLLISVGFMVTAMGALTAVSLPVIGIVLAVIAVVGLLAAAAYQIEKNWSNLMFWFGIYWDKIKDMFFNAIEFIKELFFNYHPLGIIIANWGAIIDWFVGMWAGIKNIFWDSINSIDQFFTETIENIMGKINAVKEFFTFGGSDMNAEMSKQYNVGGSVGQTIKSQSETDIKLKVSTDSGAIVTAEKFDKKKGDANVELFTDAALATGSW